MKRKILSIFMCLAMVLSVLPMGVFAAESESITYVDRAWDGEEVVSTTKEITDYELVTSSTKTLEDGKWYVLSGSVTNANRIVVNGTASLILCDNCNFSVKNGIEVPSDATLNIYGQTNDSGVFTASTDNNATIGGNSDTDGGSVFIHGGTFDLTAVNSATIGSGWGGTFGDITIYNGNITAESASNGSAIGSAYYGSVGDITIYNGSITVKNPSLGAGIGSGNYGSANDINIYNAEIEASTRYGAGIGSGNLGSVGSIIINSGNITASAENGAAIGAGDGGSAKAIVINDGTIHASASGIGGAIGAGFFGNCLLISLRSATVTAKGSDNSYSKAISADKIVFDVDTCVKYGTNENDIKGILNYSSDSITATLNNANYAYVYQSPFDFGPVSYIERDASSAVYKTITDYEVVTSFTTELENNKYYVVIKNTENDNQINVSGTAHLILMDGRTFVANGAICVNEGNSLFIYGQCADSGTLNANSHIGGTGVNGDIIINGGTINANSTGDDAAIGAGFGTTNGRIDIYGGNITAYSREGAAIGAGAHANASSSNAISIYGGTVWASSYYGTAIGAGNSSRFGEYPGLYGGGLVYLYGGSVTASSDKASAIGATNYTVSYVGGSSKTFYGNPAVLYVNPSITVHYGNDANNEVGTINTASISKNVGNTVNKYHYLSYSTAAPAITHNYAPATCIAPKTCIACGATEGEAIGHDFTKQGALVTPATCTNKAVYAVQCTRCDETNGTMEVGEPAGHKYVTTEKVSDQTCTSPAIYKAKCSVCGEMTDHFEVGEPLGHAYVFDSKGTAKCIRCSATPPAMNITTDIDSNRIAVGDLIKEGVVIRPYENGYDAYMSVGVDGKYVGAYNTYKKYTAPTCLRCVSKSAADKYYNFDIKFETACLYTVPTCNAPATCVYCGKTEGEALGHKYELIKKLSDAPLTYTAECLRCKAYNEAYEVPQRKYNYDDYVISKDIDEGDYIAPNTEISLYDAATVSGYNLKVYIDGELVHNSQDSYFAPCCLRCVDSTNTKLYFETDCLFIRANCTAPKTCVYCGHTEGEPIGGWDKVIVTAGEAEGELNLMSLINKSVIVLEAEYNKDGKMLQADYKNLDLVANEAYKYEVNLNKYTNGNNVKVFIWDNLNVIKPLSEFIEFKVK